MSDMPMFSPRELARIAVFAGLIVVLGFLAPIPVPGLVPITAQTLGVMLAGAVLGPRGGVAAVATVLLLVAIGLPVLSGGRGGLAVFVGPTAGYLVGWLLGALVVGAIVRGGAPRIWRDALATTVGGIFVIYACGIPVQSLVTGVPLAETALTSVAFLPGDAIKVACATLLLVALRRAYPVAFTPGASRAAASQR